MNLSNNSGFSECPQIAVSNNHIYGVWEDITQVIMKYYSLKEKYNKVKRI